VTHEITYAEELRHRLARLVAGEEDAWAQIEKARAAHGHLARELENSEHLMRASLVAHHAAIALRALDADEKEPEGQRLAAWVEGATDRLVRGSYLQRSTSLFARARGEIEHEAVAEVLTEVRGFLRLAAKGGAR
jgi:hypothetical protein